MSWASYTDIHTNWAFQPEGSGYPKMLGGDLKVPENSWPKANAECKGMLWQVTKHISPLSSAESANPTGPLDESLIGDHDHLSYSQQWRELESYHMQYQTSTQDF